MTVGWSSTPGGTQTRCMPIPLLRVPRLCCVAGTPDCQGHPSLLHESCPDSKPCALDRCTHRRLLRDEETGENKRSPWCQIPRQRLEHLHQRSQIDIGRDARKLVSHHLPGTVAEVYPLLQSI